MPSNLRRLWREATDLTLTRLRGRSLDWAARPEPHKSYSGVPRLEVPCGASAAAAAGTVWAALATRRSRRSFSGESITQQQLGDLLWACQGVTAQREPFLLRTAPSAGALYPFETYVSIQSVEGMQPGLVHLHVPSFSLEVLTTGTHGPHLAAAALGQSFLAHASIVVIWTVLPQRAEWKYGDRALRYLGLDLGHVCQNLYLAAESMGLGCCAVAAFLDDPMNRVLEVDGEAEFALYLAAVGPVDEPSSTPD